MSAPANATEIAQHLANLSRELDTTVDQLQKADEDATRQRAEADVAFSKAFLNAVGSVDARKHEAAIETGDLRLRADLSEATVRHLRRRLDALKTRIDVGRSYGAAVRAEIALAGSGATP